jgi:two-component system cell cycle response regulator DivK
VIVIEDDPSTLLLEIEFLEQAGVGKCEGRATGWQAVELARSGQEVDLILLDIGLAYEDGCDVVQEIKAAPELKEILVVAVTAHTDPDDLRRAREAGCDGFIGKPLSPTRFPDQIRRVLRGEGIWEMK